MDEECVAVSNLKISHVVLAVVGTAGILAIGAIAPNVVQLLRFIPKSKSRTCYTRVYVDKTTARLVKRGFLEVKRVKGQPAVGITEKGRSELAKFRMKDKLLKHERWDGKWRVLIFDIRENKRQARDSLRKELVGIGFVRLQNSVWVNPYECTDVTVLLKTDLELGKDLLYLTVEKLENDGWLKKRFALP